MPYKVSCTCVYISGLPGRPALADGTHLVKLMFTTTTTIRTFTVMVGGDERMRRRRGILI